MKTWLLLSSVSPLCGYMLQMTEDSGVILHSPLPACHSEPLVRSSIMPCRCLQMFNLLPYCFYFNRVPVFSLSHSLSLVLTLMTTVQACDEGPRTETSPIVYIGEVGPYKNMHIVNANQLITTV